MKKVFIITLLLLVGIVSNINSQTLPSDVANGFAFPIGSKFTIKLVPTDTLNYDYSVTALDPFQEVVDAWNVDSLFSKEGEPNTIVGYFCFGTHGNTDEEKEKNMKVLLILKNYTTKILKYSSDIQVQEEGEFETTSNVGIFPGAIAKEIWPYMIYSIGLYDFKINSIF